MLFSNHLPVILFFCCYVFCILISNIFDLEVLYYRSYAFTNVLRNHSCHFITYPIRL